MSPPKFWTVSHREGRWRFQRARAVIVAGYAIETPRLLLNSATEQFPDGLANSSGLVGRYLMSQANQAAWGYMDEPVRAYKAPPSTAITEHWNYEDRKDFHGGYCWMAQGPLPIEAMTIITGSKGLWGAALHEEMLRYNHLIGLKMVGEQLPNPDNRVTLADETDQYGLRIPRITYSWSDNDKTMIGHALDQMSESLEVVGAKRYLASGQRHEPSRGDSPNGVHAAGQRDQRRLSKLGHPESLRLRRLGLSDDRRRQPVADNHCARNAGG
jgi:choline dehydrogenase-like flavoprotein